MSHSAADNRRVFLAYRTLFTGPEAQIRKSTKVRKIVTKHQGSFHPLIRDLGLPKIVEIVKILLDQQVFESELKAKIVFPELFQTSPERNVQRNASEKEATRSIAEAIEEAVLVDGSEKCVAAAPVVAAPAATNPIATAIADGNGNDMPQGRFAQRFLNVDTCES
jgi:hypothetical protein